MVAFNIASVVNQGRLQVPASGGAVVTVVAAMNRRHDSLQSCIFKASMSMLFLRQTQVLTFMGEDKGHASDIKMSSGSFISQ